MKKLKLLFLTLMAFTLVGCGNAKEAVAAVDTPTYIPVESITTTDPAITVEVGQEYVLLYMIAPENATNKSITYDDTYLKDVARVEIDADYTVSVYGRGIGTGVLSLVTNNNKYVSYSITVIPNDPEPTPEPLVYEVEDLVRYYNAAVPEEYMRVQYRVESNDWFMEYEYDISDDTSAENLKRPVEYLRQFMPMKNEVDGGFLMEDMRGTKEATVAVPFKRYFLIAVSPTFFAVTTIRGLVYEGKLYAQVFIYDGRHGTYA